MRKIIGAMKISIDGKTEGPEGYADWVDTWSDDYGLTPQIDACVLGGGMYPNYEQYWTAIQDAPDDPNPMGSRRPHPSRGRMGPLRGDHPALCAVAHAHLGQVAADELPARTRRARTPQAAGRQGHLLDGWGRDHTGVPQGGTGGRTPVHRPPLDRGYGHSIVHGAESGTDLSCAMSRRCPMAA